MVAMPRAAHSTQSARPLPMWVGWLVAAVAGVAVALVLVWFSGRPPLEETLAEPSPSPSPSPTFQSPPPSPSPTPEPVIPTVQFTLVAAGDVLTHTPVNASATSGGVIDYSPLMAALDPYVSGADLAWCHLEIPIAPAGQSPSGYPMFAAPAELVGDIAEAGWDGCSQASNHSVDRKFAGVVTTLDWFDAYRLGFAGTARTAEEATRVQLYSVREGSRVIKVGHISFTYGLNGLPMPSEAPWAVNVFNANAADASPIIAAAQEARAQGADIVVASVHCCVEYQTAPTAAQRSIVEQIGASGEVDLYIGHHAHVPQPIELIPGGPSGEGMWAAFGLGNYISNQDTQCCVPHTNSGVLLTATFTVDPEDHVSVGVEWTAITVDRLNRHTMYVLRDVPDGAGRLSAAEVQARLTRVAEAVGPQAPERVTPPPTLADAAYVDPRKPWSPS